MFDLIAVCRWQFWQIDNRRWSGDFSEWERRQESVWRSSTDLKYSFDFQINVVAQLKTDFQALCKHPEGDGEHRWWQTLYFECCLVDSLLNERKQSCVDGNISYDAIKIW